MISMQKIKQLKENMDLLVALSEDGVCSFGDKEKEACRLLWERYNKLLKEEIMETLRLLTKE